MLKRSADHGVEVSRRWHLARGPCHRPQPGGCAGLVDRHVYTSTIRCICLCHLFPLLSSYQVNLGALHHESVFALLNVCCKVKLCCSNFPHRVLAYYWSRLSRPEAVVQLQFPSCAKDDCRDVAHGVIQEHFSSLPLP